jgi:hypothetical protein
MEKKETDTIGCFGGSDGGNLDEKKSRYRELVQEKR